MTCVATRNLVHGNPSSDELLPTETDLLNADRCIALPVTALAYHGAFGAAFWHFAVLLGQNRVLEFGPTYGIVTDRKLCGAGSLLDEARRKSHKCPHADAVAPLLVLRLDPNARGAPLRGLPWPAYPLVSQRIQWVRTHLRASDYDVLGLNCEHVARYVVTGKAVCTQSLHVLRADPRLTALAPVVRRLAPAYRARRQALMLAVLGVLLLLWRGRPLLKCLPAPPRLRGGCPRPR